MTTRLVKSCSFGEWEGINTASIFRAADYSRTSTARTPLELLKHVRYLLDDHMYVWQNTILLHTPVGLYVVLSQIRNVCFA